MRGRSNKALVFLVAISAVAGVVLWRSVSRVSPGEREALGPDPTRAPAELGKEKRGLGVPFLPAGEAPELRARTVADLAPAPGEQPPRTGIPAPLLVSGTVRDARGAALPEVRIVVRPLHGGILGRVRTTKEEGGVPAGGEPLLADPRWLPFTDSEGRSRVGWETDETPQSFQFTIKVGGASGGVESFLTDPRVLAFLESERRSLAVGETAEAPRVFPLTTENGRIPVGGERFLTDPHWLAFTDSEGRFRVEGGAAEAPLSLQLTRDGYQEQRTEVAPGTSGLELVLYQKVTGRVLLAEGVGGAAMSVHVRRTGSAADEKPVHTLELGADGYFEVPTLEPGLYELAFKHEKRKDFLYTVGPLECPFDEAAAERLARIDLRHLVRHLRFTVFDGRALPVLHGTVRWRGVGDPEAPWISHVIDQGVAEFNAPWPEIDLRVRVAKHESLELLSVRNGCRLDLVPVGGISLELDPDCDLQGHDLVLYLNQPWLQKKRLCFRPTLAGRLQHPDLPEAGRWNLEWWVISERKGSEGEARRYGERLPTSADPVPGRDYIDVAELRLAQRFVVAPEASVLAELLEERR